MLFPSKKDPVVGIDIGSNSVKLVQLEETKGGHSLKAFGSFELERETIYEDNIEKPEVIVNAIRTLVSTENISTKNAVVAIPGRAVVIKKITLPASSEYDVGDLLSIEAEQYIPFDVSEAALDYHIISESETIEDDEDAQREVLLIAAEQEKVNDYKSLVEEAGLNPIVVDVDVFAIENGYELNYGVDEDAVIALIDAGAGVTSVNILEEGITTFTRDINCGGDVITFTIRDELEIDVEMAEQLKKGAVMEGISPLKIKGIIIEALEELCSEVSNSFELFRETSEAAIEKILLTGGTAKIEGIDKFMSGKLEIPVEIANSFRKIEVNEKVYDPEYIEYMAPIAVVGVGLAMRRFEDKLVTSA